MRDTGNTINLLIPKYVHRQGKPFLEGSVAYFENRLWGLEDVLINIMIFIPMAFLLHAMFRARYGLSLKISIWTFVIGAFLTFGIESLQYLSMTRHSSLIDVITNMIGLISGITMDRAYWGYLNNRAV